MGHPIVTSHLTNGVYMLTQRLMMDLGLCCYLYTFDKGFSIGYGLMAVICYFFGVIDCHTNEDKKAAVELS